MWITSSRILREARRDKDGRAKQKTDKLYDCGVKKVIMKIGKRGCYIRNKDGAMIVPACKG